MSAREELSHAVRQRLVMARDIASTDDLFAVMHGCGCATHDALSDAALEATTRRVATAAADALLGGVAGAGDDAATAEDMLRVGTISSVVSSAGLDPEMSGGGQRSSS